METCVNGDQREIRLFLVKGTFIGVRERASSRKSKLKGCVCMAEGNPCITRIALNYRCHKCIIDSGD